MLCRTQSAVAISVAATALFRTRVQPAPIQRSTLARIGCVIASLHDGKGILRRQRFAARAKRHVAAGHPRDCASALCPSPRPGASTIVVGRLRVRLGTLGFLCRGRLALHLLLRILRRGRRIVGFAIHCAGRWVLFGVAGHAGGLAGSGRCGSGTCVLQVCGSTGIAGTCHCGTGAQDDRGATRENDSLHVHLLLLFGLTLAPARHGR
jgi:hypothetical protein